MTHLFRLNKRDHLTRTTMTLTQLAVSASSESLVQPTTHRQLRRLGEEVKALEAALDSSKVQEKGLPKGPSRICFEHLYVLPVFLFRDRL